jgi:hypothetical protein
MSLTGFQRRRRELAKRKAEQEAKVLAEQENAAESQNEASNDEQDLKEKAKQLTKDDVDKMDIKSVKEILDALGVKYSHNTGEKKLREKLKDAIS